MEEKRVFSRGFLGLTALAACFLGAAVWYTFRVGWYPQSADWKGAAVHLLQHGDLQGISFCAILSFFGLLVLVNLLGRIPSFHGQEAEGPFTESPFPLVMILLLTAWMPFFLVFFPGTAMNDTTDILRGELWAAGQHTFLYCLFLGTLGEISHFLTGNWAAGVAVASILQMYLLAAAIAYTVSWFYRRTGQRVLMVFLVCYYAFCPMVVNYSFANVKDTLFSAAVLLWVPLLYELVSDDSPRGWDRMRMEFLLFSAGILLLRNNGRYVYAVLMVLLFLVLKEIRWKVFLLGTGLFLLSLVPNAALSFFMDLPQLFQERVGIPIQQIGRVVDHRRTLTEKEQSYLDQVMYLGRLEMVYDPFTADGIKWDRYFHSSYFNTHPQEFWDVWRSIGRRYPVDYIEAWMLASYGYWAFPAPDEKTQSRFGWALSMKDLMAPYGMDPLRNNDYQVGTLLQVYPPEIQEKMGRYLWDHSRYLGAGTCFWVTVLAALVLIYRRRSRLLILLMPAFLIWGTLIAATPAAFVFRYVFYFPLCLPVFILLPYFPDSKT